MSRVEIITIMEQEKKSGELNSRVEIIIIKKQTELNELL